MLRNLQSMRLCGCVNCRSLRRGSQRVCQMEVTTDDGFDRGISKLLILCAYPSGTPVTDAPAMTTLGAPFASPRTLQVRSHDGQCSPKKRRFAAPYGGRFQCEETVAADLGEESYGYDDARG